MKQYFERLSPESQGIPSPVLLDWVHDLQQIKYVHSFMLLRHGIVVAEAWNEPYRPDVQHRLYSTSKSFTSLAIGFAECEGLLSLSDTVWKFFKDEYPESILSPKMARMTIHDLLTMTTGHENCAWDAYMHAPGVTDYVKGFLSSPLAYEPGTHFVYNSGATYMLSAVIRKITGMDLMDYLKPRLFTPLDMTELKWQRCPAGLSIGAFGFNLTTENMAKFGQFLLQKGQWEGRQLIPQNYIERASAKQSDNSYRIEPDWKQGYGFQMWRSQHNAFRCDGWCGQFILVIPDQDMVMCMTGGFPDMQQVLTSLWNHVLPHVSAAALPEDPSSLEHLRYQCRSMRIPLPDGDTVSRGSDAVYAFDNNTIGFRSLKLSFNENSCVLEFDGPHGHESLRAGFGKYLDNPRLQLMDFDVCRVSAAACREAPDTLLIRTIWFETPFVIDFHLVFQADGTITFREDANLRFQSQPWPLLTGRLQK